ncbi:hypothetical protein GGS24DRAFT_39064 [Hypoxylon argillaceum]|nr:hypothetical protein GGS24DRAFT_39064 [Hypoxylon argillaceum]
MRALPLPFPAPILFILLLQTGSSLAIDNDFSSYPEGSQQCLYDSADAAGCSSGSSGTELNQCLCKNKNNFVYNTASCIAATSPSDADAVYETLSSNCAGTGVTLSVPKQAFLAAATAAQTTSTASSTATGTATGTTTGTATGTVTGTATGTTTTTPTSTTTGSTDPSQPASADDGLSIGTKIAIGAGVGFGVVAAALAAWFTRAYQRRRRSAQSIHSNDASGSASAFGMANEPHHTYAHNNIQQGPVEISDPAWAPPAGYALPGPSEDKKYGVAGMPLLAELGNESATQLAPVELPADTSYHEYYDRSLVNSPNPGYGHAPVTPEGLSPYTHSVRSDFSPVTPSQVSEIGTYR